MFTKGTSRLFGGISRQIFLPGDKFLQHLWNLAEVNLREFQKLTLSQPVKNLQSCNVSQKVTGFAANNKYLTQTPLSSWCNPASHSNKLLPVQCTACISQQFRYMCTKPTVSKGTGLNIVQESDVLVSQTKPRKLTQPLDTKPRTGRKKQTALQRGDHMVSCYAVGEKLFVDNFKKILLEDNLYKISPVITGNLNSAINDNLLGALDLHITSLPPDLEDILHVTNRYKTGENQPSKDIFFFEEGSVVFWNIPEEERMAVLKKVQNHCLEVYEEKQMTGESDSMEVRYTKGPTDLVDEVIHVNEEASTSSENLILEKYSFSNALSQSVKLAVWEYKLDVISDSCEPISRDLRLGYKIGVSGKSVLRLLGEVYTLRHKINMNSDLLDSPDFYWDRNQLEVLYNKTCKFLSITKRTKVINEKMNYCRELLELVKDLETTSHSFRIERAIVLLILVEVIIGLWDRMLTGIAEWIKDMLANTAMSSDDVLLQVSP